MSKEDFDKKSPSADLNDYEVEVKKGFFSSLLDKFKTKQKLLNSGNSEKTVFTNRSISSLWGFGNFRKTLFDALDNVQKIFSSNSKSTKPQNSLIPEIINSDSNSLDYTSSKEDLSQNVETLQKPIIRPVVKTTTPKKIINNSKTADDIKNEETEFELEDTENNFEIEVSSIDTSAIENKKEPFKKETNINKTPKDNSDIER